MSDKTISRRTFLKGAGAGFALATLAGLPLSTGFAEQMLAAGEVQAPFTAGTQRPRIKVPAYACDCHHHIYNPARFPYLPEDTRNQPPGTVSDYRLLQKRLGTSRNVIIQPSAYGTDNRCTLDALDEMGSKTTRAIVVVDDSITDAELEKMHQLGVRGIRINIASETVMDLMGTLETLSGRVNELGWHVQFWMKAEDVVTYAALLQRLPSPLVFDHLAHIPQPAGVNHPAFRVVSNLIDKGKTWIKLSGAYQDTKVGSPTYADVTKVAQAFVKGAPERMVWGSDWPHPSIFSWRKPWPDDAQLLDLLAEWAPDEATRNRILVDNPEVLYGFSRDI
ncbi:MAG: amidohydrolase family protein [Negativicutes bacterium]|nr:amidohydrolase family protein [Negativicutes bacterium]